MSGIKLRRNRFTFVQALPQFRERWPLCDFLDLSQQIVRKRHTCHGSASFQAAVQGIGYITKLNHLGHATSILSCYTHVKLGLPFPTSSSLRPNPYLGCVWLLMCQLCARTPPDRKSP